MWKAVGERWSKAAMHMHMCSFSSSCMQVALGVPSHAFMPMHAWQHEIVELNPFNNHSMHVALFSCIWVYGGIALLEVHGSLPFTLP